MLTLTKTLSQTFTEKSNKIFENLHRKGFISEKQLKYYRFNFKISCNLEKLYLLHKIH